MNIQINYIRILMISFQSLKNVEKEEKLAIFFSLRADNFHGKNSSLHAYLRYRILFVIQ